MPSPMEDPDNGNTICLDAIEDAIREVANQAPSRIAVDHCVRLRVLPYAIKHVLHSREELLAKPHTLPLVPGVCVIQLILGFGAEDYRDAHLGRLRCAFTASQGITSSGFSSRAVSLRSSSSRCARVRGGAPPASTMRSQTSSTSRILSSSGHPSISCRTVVMSIASRYLRISAQPGRGGVCAATTRHAAGLFHYSIPAPLRGAPRGDAERAPCRRHLTGVRAGGYAGRDVRWP